MMRIHYSIRTNAHNFQHSRLLQEQIEPLAWLTALMLKKIMKVAKLGDATEGLPLAMIWSTP